LFVKYVQRDKVEAPGRLRATPTANAASDEPLVERPLPAWRPALFFLRMVVVLDVSVAPDPGIAKTITRPRPMVVV
jgi:hypothetical protein